MKKKIIVAVLATGMLLGAAYAFGQRCMSCGGTGFVGNYNCVNCKGTGRSGDY